MKRKRQKKNAYALVYDIVIIAAGIAITFFLSRAGVVDEMIVAFTNHTILASFLAGIFFTSTFTIAPASVAIAHIAEHAPIPQVALWGALGAVVGDLILFLFIKDRFTDDLMSLVKPSTKRHILNSFHVGFMKWISPIIGTIIIASPLPDEFAVSILGMSKIKISLLIPLSFVGNVIGIYFIIGFANLIS